MLDILPSACLKALEVEKAAYAGFVACFKEDCRKVFLGTAATGRKEAREVVAIDRETVRGIVRVKVRSDSILMDDGGEYR